MDHQDTIYVEELTCFALIMTLLVGGRGQKCFYLHQSKSAKRLAKILYRSKVLVYLPHTLDFNYANLKDPAGSHVFEVINEHLVEMSSRVADRIAATFYSTLSPLVDQKRLNLFFYKLIAHKSHNSTIFLYAISRREKCFCILPSSPWGQELRQYAESLGLSVMIVPSLKHSGFLELFRRIILLRREKPKNQGAVGDEVPVPTATVGVWYAGRTLDKDIKKRKEMFWLYEDGPIKPSDVLLYFERKDIVPPREGVQIMHNMGVKVASFYQINTLTSTPVWRRSKEYTRQIQQQLRRVVWGYIKSWFALKPVPFYFIERMAWFVKTYALWFDFFQATGIKVNIYGDFINPGQIAVNQAMRHQGGVNAVYQWTHLHFHSAFLSLDTDVLFAFGPAYAPYWQLNKSLIGEYVSVGYPWNVQNDALRRSALSMRSKITTKGATFIICYLDENSSDDRFSVISNTRARAIYTFWLEQILKDQTLGIIFKPAYIHDFDKRIFKPLKDLFDKALATGRCVIIGDGHYKTDTLPAEVGLAADVTVGLLIAGTAVLEAVLAGSRAVFLDLEGLYYEDIYQWGKDRVVFSSYEQLAQAIARYRKDPLLFPSFGDLQEWAHRNDPFHDGKGPTRVAEYIKMLVNERKKVAA